MGYFSDWEIPIKFQKEKTTSFCKFQLFLEIFSGMNISNQTFKDMLIKEFRNNIFFCTHETQMIFSYKI